MNFTMKSWLYLSTPGIGNVSLLLWYMDPLICGNHNVCIFISLRGNSCRKDVSLTNFNSFLKSTHIVSMPWISHQRTQTSCLSHKQYCEAWGQRHWEGVGGAGCSSPQTWERPLKVMKFLCNYSGIFSSLLYLILPSKTGHIWKE